MRLIDADKVLKCKTHGYIDLITDRSEEVVRVRAIEHAQTIDAVVIPKGATNGDVIKLVFPNIEIADTEVLKHVYTSVPYGELVGANIDCMRDWWNARYTTDRPTCEDCHNFGTVNCSETYREPCKNDDVCETFERR